MKFYKKIYIPILILLFTSCNMSTESGSRSHEDILLDLSDVVLIIPAIEAGLEVVNEESVLDTSRALDPKRVSGDDSDLMAKYFGSNWSTSPLTPYGVYTENPSEIDSDGVLRIPSSGYISGIYGKSNNDFYMTMELESETEPTYRIKLYIYPRDIFSIDYIYEEYIVDENDVQNSDSWAWSWFDDYGTYQDYISEKTYYRDDSVLTKDSKSGEFLYNEVKSEAPSLTFSIEDLISDYSDYIYPDSIPTPTTSTGTFSSKSTGYLKGKQGLKRDVVEFYTENDIDSDDLPDFSYSVLYMEGTKRNDITENVTRYYSDLNTEETNIVSINTNGDYYTQFNRIHKTTTDYSSESHVWYVPISNSLDIDSAASTYNTLTVNSADNTLYTGVIKYYWGSYGISYNYSVNSESGIMDLSWLGVISRSSDTLNSTSIDLSDLENISIENSSSNWSFIGSYEMGELVGTYKYKGSDYDVNLYPAGLEIDGSFYDWQ